MSIREHFDTSSSSGKDRKVDPNLVYSIDESQPKNRCRLIVNGMTCRMNAPARGLCPNHYTRLAKAGVLEKYARVRLRKKNGSKNGI